jgi:E3 ubiquitin-protein ligase DOA10
MNNAILSVALYKKLCAIVLVISYFSCLAMRIWSTPMQTLCLMWPLTQNLIVFSRKPA